MNSRTAIVTAAAFGLALLAPVRSLATPINGSQLNISGDGIVGTTFLNWLCNQPGDPMCVTPPANHGDFSIAGSTGSFAQYNGTFGLATNINNAAQPLNAPFSLPNFITFDLNSNETIELTFIPLGTDTASTDCAGLQHCTPQNNLLITPSNTAGLSAFNLDQNGTGTAATFGINGIVHEVGGATATLAGTYTAQFTGMTPQQVLALATSGANSTYSSNLLLTVTSTGVPEPGPLLLGGFGLLAIGMISRRRAVK